MTSIKVKEYDNETMVIGYVGRSKTIKVSVIGKEIEIVSSQTLPSEIEEAREFLSLYAEAMNKAEEIAKGIQN